MKIKTVYTTPRPIHKPKPRTDEDQEEHNRLYQWTVWEYKEKKNSNYDNHILYRKATYSGSNLNTKMRFERNHPNDKTNRWKIYKKVKKTLV